MAFLSRWRASPAPARARSRVRIGRSTGAVVLDKDTDQRAFDRGRRRARSDAWAATSYAVFFSLAESLLAAGLQRRHRQPAPSDSHNRDEAGGIAARDSTLDYYIDRVPMHPMPKSQERSADNAGTGEVSQPRSACAGNRNIAPARVVLLSVAEPHLHTRHDAAARGSALRQGAGVPRPMTRVKICGCRTSEQALAAAEAGADFIGMMFCREPPPGRARGRLGHRARPRHAAARARAGVAAGAVSHRRAATSRSWFEHGASALERLLERKRPLTVGVFADNDPDEINEIVDECGIDLIQLSGGEPWGALSCWPTVR